MQRAKQVVLWGSLAAIVTALAATAVSALTILECKDKDGTVSFSDLCPPGSVKIGERRYAAIGGERNPDARYAPERPTITLYSVANCDACDLVRNVLDTRAVPYNEKNVADDAATQEELRTATGALNVPTVLIGTTPLSGYNRSALEAALNNAGYTAPASAEATQSPSPPAP
jgi:glutaredoxin